ncbi:hypothetical protein G9A89_006178 [Geosiphon pyriformis]|nr:hypothetical protein G9A89_006178 [Geosiphon pyriformis]
MQDESDEYIELEKKRNIRQGLIRELQYQDVSKLVFRFTNEKDTSEADSSPFSEFVPTLARLLDRGTKTSKSFTSDFSDSKSKVSRPTESQVSLKAKVSAPPMFQTEVKIFTQKTGLNPLKEKFTVVIFNTLSISILGQEMAVCLTAISTTALEILSYELSSG